MNGTKDDTGAMVLVSALERLKTGASKDDFNFVLEHLETLLINFDISGRSLEGVDMYRNQGKCTVLDEFLTLVDDTRTIRLRILNNRGRAARKGKTS